MRPGGGGPSILGRLMLALVAAFLLVWAALFAFLALSALARGTGEIDTRTLELAQAASATFAGLGGVEAVRIAAAALAEVSARQTAAAAGETYGTRPPDGFVVVLGADGADVYRSPATPEADFTGVEPGFSTRQVEGRTWHLALARSGPWATLIGYAGDLRGAVLPGLGLELAAYVGAAFLVVLAALLVAARGGLAPLSRLSRAVQARAPGDLSPLGVEVRHRELKPLAGAIDALLARQAAAIRREVAFVHDAAHEIRTPLAVIGAQAHCLARADAEAGREEALARLGQALERASRLAGQLLRLAQVEGHRAGPAPGPVDLRALAEQALADQAERAEAQGVELALEGPEQIQVRGDPMTLRSLLDNLIENALIHGAGAGGHVWVRLEAGEGAIRLAVADDGPGIPPVERERVFARFERLNWAGAPGTGLGLTIVREAAATLGGRVEIGDGPQGKGCRVLVCLPCRLGP